MTPLAQTPIMRMVVLHGKYVAVRLSSSRHLSQSALSLLYRSSRRRFHRLFLLFRFEE